MLLYLELTTAIYYCLWFFKAYPMNDLYFQLLQRMWPWKEGKLVKELCSEYFWNRSSLSGQFTANRFSIPCYITICFYVVGISLKYRVALVRTQSSLAEDLDVIPLLDQLLSKLVISPEDCRNVNGHETRQEQARRLLELLPELGQGALEEFRKHLHTNQEWLHQLLEQEVENITAGDSLLLHTICLLNPYSSGFGGKVPSSDIWWLFDRF